MRLLTRIRGAKTDAGAAAPDVPLTSAPEMLAVHGFHDGVRDCTKSRTTVYPGAGRRRGGPVSASRPLADSIAMSAPLMASDATPGSHMRLLPRRRGGSGRDDVTVHTIAVDPATVSPGYVLGVATAQVEACRAYLDQSAVYPDALRHRDRLNRPDVVAVFLATAAVLARAQAVRDDLAQLHQSQAALTGPGTAEAALAASHAETITALTVRLGEYQNAIGEGLRACQAAALGAGQDAQWAMEAQVRLDAIASGIAVTQSIDIGPDEVLARLRAATETAGKALMILPSAPKTARRPFRR